MRELHALMVRAAGHQVWRMRAALPDPSPGRRRRHRQPGRRRGHDLAARQAAHLRGPQPVHAPGRSSSPSSRRPPRSAACSGSTARSSCATSTCPSAAHDSPEHHAEGNDLAGAVADAMRRASSPPTSDASPSRCSSMASPSTSSPNVSGPAAARSTRPSTTSGSACARELTAQGYLLPTGTPAPLPRQLRPSTTPAGTR